MAVAIPTRERAPSRAFTPSLYQQAIFGRLADRRGGHLQVNAVAGSGKTTTIIEALSRQPFDVLQSTLLCAFNREIAGTLEQRAPRGVTVKTNHGIGFGTLAYHFGSKAGGRWKPEVDERKYRRLIEIYWTRNHRSPFDPETDAEREMFKLVHFARVCLVDPADGNAVLAMADERDLELPDSVAMLNALPVILRWGAEGLPTPDEAGKWYAPLECIDFDDMVWLPWRLNLQPKKFKLVLVDECQDLNAAQLDLILKCLAPGARLVAVGDPRQAIYAFCGADSRSFDKITWRTRAEVLPLSVCYRCPRSVIRLAQEIVPEIEAAPDAPEGTVQAIKEATFFAEVTAHDMVLCRVTADLIAAAFALIRMGKPARVRGRDIGAQLLKVLDAVEKLEGFTFTEFARFTEKYREQHARVLAQKANTEAQVMALHDRVDSIQAVYENAVLEGAQSMGDLRAYVQTLFADDGRGLIMLSTIHRAKGLEAERVFLLRPDKLPHPMANTPAAREQEENLRYVAYTRALRELFIVEPPAPGR